MATLAAAALMGAWFPSAAAARPSAAPPTTLGRALPEPVVTATATTSDGRPGQPVNVSFAITAGWTIDSCWAGFAGYSAADCTRTDTGMAAQLIVPDDAKPGSTKIAWTAYYVPNQTSSVAAPSPDTQDGTIDFTVRATTFTVVPSPRAAKPGQSVTVTFTADARDTTIVACSAGFSGGTPQACTGSRSGWSAVLPVPDAARAGATSIAWTVTYEAAGIYGQSRASGTVPFTVLAAGGQTTQTTSPTGQASSPASAPVEQTEPASSNSPWRMLPWLLLLLVLIAAGVTAALLGRRHRRRVAARTRSEAVPPPPEVRAVPHARAPVQVTTQEGDRGDTRVMRVEPHDCGIAVRIREVL